MRVIRGLGLGLEVKSCDLCGHELGLQMVDAPQWGDKVRHGTGPALHSALVTANLSYDTEVPRRVSGGQS